MTCAARAFCDASPEHCTGREMAWNVFGTRRSGSHACMADGGEPGQKQNTPAMIDELDNFWWW